MTAYSLSEKADLDIDKYYETGILNFGIEQAKSYFLAMHDCFSLLADNPEMGRKVDYLKKLLRRFEFQSHVIFYYRKDHGIHISRVLGAEMDFVRHL